MRSYSWIKGKTCLITGANTGIGKETTRQIAELGARVVMVCRNKEKGEKARQEIVETTNNKDIDLLICDLSSLKNVKQFSEEFFADYTELHVLINNAGVYHMKRTETNDGYESAFAINYLAHFYLSRLLLPLLKKSAPSRIINLSSNIHKFYKIKLRDLMLEKRYNGQQAYSNSKSAMILFTYRLARLLKESEVAVNAVNPGHVETQMTTIGLPKSFIKIRDLIVKSQTPEEGAKTSVYVASANNLERITGRYYDRCEESKSGKFTYDIDKQDLLWDLSNQLIEKIIGKED
jgi:NAD(P)-dependent dehydrogenase (short-subunit alcohol dehydrogenase family)